jgi:hypothetical protein
MVRVDRATEDIMQHRHRVATCVAILIGLVPASGHARFGAHLEGGYGSSNVRPLVEESSSSVCACAGLSTSLVRTLRVGLEVSATTSTSNGGIRIPESSRPGDRNRSW